MGDKPSKERDNVSAKLSLARSFDPRVSAGDSENFQEDLKFLIILENIKCKNLTQSDVFVEFNFNNEKRITTSIIPNQPHPKWEIKESFEFSTNTKKIQESFLTIALKNQNDTTLSEIFLNLYDVATGPVLNDITLENKPMKMNGRLFFNLRMLQKIRMVIIPETVKLEFPEPRKERSYFFSLKMVNCECDELISENSQVLVRGESKNEEDFDLSMILEQSSASRPETVLNQTLAPAKTTSSAKELKWEYPVSKSIKRSVTDAKSAGTPIIETEILTNEFGSNCLTVSLFSPRIARSTQDLDSQQSKKIIGDCSISLIKLFKEDIYHYDMNHSEQGLRFVEVRNQKSAKEKFWRKGNQIGFLEARFKLLSQKFVRQHIIGVRTENGIQKDSSFFMRSESETSKKIPLPKEVREFLTLKDHLLDSLFKLYDPHSLGNSMKSQLQRSDLRLEIDKNLSRLKESLKSSMKNQPISSFLFNNSRELLKTQTAMIELCEHLLNYVEEIDETLQKSTYECLKLILNRGELDLACMGFEQKYSAFFDPQSSFEAFLKDPNFKKDDQNHLKSKLKIALKYQEVFKKALYYVLSKFPQSDEKEQGFFDIVCVLAYFRLPEFRKKFLECIKRNDDEVMEWRGSEWGIDEKISENQREKSLISLFSWEKDFNLYVKSSAEGQKLYHELATILNTESWQKRYKERNEAFFSFLAEWNKYVHKKITLKEHIPWEDLPGYRILLKAFLVELKNREIVKYPVTLKQAATNFLLHEKLLNIFIALVYNKTKVYDGMTTYTTFDMINRWLGNLMMNNKKIPSFFDFLFFFQGIQKAVDQDHVYGLGKCVLMIYNNFQLFSAEHKNRICEFLLGKVFFKLFMHWSKDIRNIFHHLLLFRIFHLHRNIKTNLSNTSDIKRELSLYNTRREKLKNDKKCLINDFINMKYSKMMTILENSRTDLENEEFFSTPKKRTISSLKERLLEMKKSKALKKDITLFSSPIKTFKSPISPQGSVIFINTSSFHQNPVNATKSMSVSMDFALEETNENQFELLMEEEEGSNRKDSFLDSDEEMDKASPLIEKFKFPEMKKFTASMRENDIGSHLRKMNAKQKTSSSVILNKKMVYYDEEENEYYQIPPEYLKYLLLSFQEFDAINRSYLEWYKLIYYKFSKEGKKVDSSSSAYYQSEVPKLDIKWIFDKEEDDKIGT